jgi:hypothetical protein
VWRRSRDSSRRFPDLDPCTGTVHDHPGTVHDHPGTTAAPTTTATPTTAAPTATNDYDYRQDDENILNHMFASNEACLIDELSAQVIDELQLRPMTFWEQDSALRCTASPEDGSQQQPGHPEST